MVITNQAVLLSLIVGIAIFLIIIAIATLIYENNEKRSVYRRDNRDDWLFHNFYSKCYSAIYGDTDPDIIAIKLGIHIEKYYKNCKLVRQEPAAERIVMKFIYGLVALFISILCAIFFSPVFIMLGISLFLYWGFYETESVDTKAEEKKLQVRSELPKFLDLLSTELEIGLPVDTAIRILSQKYDSLLSHEFQESLSEVEFGSIGWQDALEAVAQKYSIDTLSDFVLDITIAFNKGVSVKDSVTRKAEEIKQKHLLDVKERAGKAENTILIPIALLQFVPMLAVILIPILFAVTNF